MGGTPAVRRPRRAGTAARLPAEDDDAAHLPR